MNNGNSILYRADKETLIRFQVIVYCYMEGHMTSEKPLTITDINCLTLMGLLGKTDVIVLCNDMVKYGLSKSVAYARGILYKLEEVGLVVKEKSHKQYKAVALKEGIVHCTEDDNDRVIEIKTYPYETA